MTKPFVFEKPLGMRDLLPEAVERKRELLNRMQREISKWGYRPVETPMLEYYDTVGGVSATLEQKLFKLFDRSGRTVVLRPDLTAPIARVVSSVMKEYAFPIRLCYQGQVFRTQEKEAGRNAEFPEIGIELIGEEAPDADAEVIALATATLKATEVHDFAITISHAGLIHTLFQACVGQDQVETDLKQYLYKKNYVGYRQAIHELDVSSEKKELLLSLLEWHGGKDCLEKIKQAKAQEQPAISEALTELNELWSLLEAYGVTSHITLDLSLMREMDYYSGVHFEVYSAALGFPIGNGGRYDNLLARFERPAPAIGFSLKVDRVLEASKMRIQRTEKRLLITYTSEQRIEALQLAEKKRAQGQQVILHRIQSGMDLNPEEHDVEQHIALEKGESVK